MFSSTIPALVFAAAGLCPAAVDEVRWSSDLATAQAAAKSSGRPLLLVFR